MGCDAAENYMFLEIHNCVGLQYGEVAKNFMFSHILYRWMIEQPDTQQCNGIKNCEMGMCMRKYCVKIIWKPLSLKMSTILRVRS